MEPAQRIRPAKQTTRGQSGIPWAAPFFRISIVQRCTFNPTTAAPILAFPLAVKHHRRCSWYRETLRAVSTTAGLNDACDPLRGFSVLLPGRDYVTLSVTICIYSTV